MAARAIAFDNSVVSALVKSVVDPAELSDDDKDRAKRARALVKAIQTENEKRREEKKTTINIPMPAITECLAGWPVDKHVDVLKELRAIGAPCHFDDRASIFAARALREQIDKGRKPATGERHVVKFDVMIAACALAADVEVLFHAESGSFSSLNDLDVFKGELAFEGLPAAPKELFDGLGTTPENQAKIGKSKEEPKKNNTRESVKRKAPPEVGLE